MQGARENADGYGPGRKMSEVRLRYALILLALAGCPKKAPPAAAEGGGTEDI